MKVKCRKNTSTHMCTLIWMLVHYIHGLCTCEKAYQVVMGVCSRFKFLSNGYLRIKQLMNIHETKHAKVKYRTTLTF